MIKTHKKSRIYRIAERELEGIDGVVIQIEHIAEPVVNVYHCFVEVVPTAEYEAEMKHDRIEKALNEIRAAHERLCESILRAFGECDSAETAEIKDHGI